MTIIGPGRSCNRSESRPRCTMKRSSKSSGSSPFASMSSDSLSKSRRHCSYVSVIAMPIGVSMKTGTSGMRRCSTRLFKNYRSDCVRPIANDGTSTFDLRSIAWSRIDSSVLWMCSCVCVCSRSA